MPRRVALIAVALLALTACSKGGGATAGGAAPENPKFAGLDAQILAWRGDLLKTTPACANAPAGKTCEAFEVACKGELPVAATDAAKGITAVVVAAMTYNGWDRSHEEFKAQSAFAKFSKAGDVWTRKETAPVNLSTCAAA